MSRAIGVVSGSNAALQTLAASLVSKAAGTGVTVGAESATSSASVSLGGVPKNAHSCVIKAKPAKGIYAGNNITFVRSVLPRGADDSLQLRDALDAFPASGIDASCEVAAAKDSLALTAKVAVDAAKSNGGKMTVVVKKQSKFAQVNELFAEVVGNAAKDAGVAVDFVGSAEATNQLIMFPEQASRVIATADTAAADSLELALSGIYGAARSYIRDNGDATPAGHSPATTAMAVAEALTEMGMTAEAKKVTDAAGL